MKNNMIILLLIASFSTAFLADQTDRVAALLQQGQAHELGKLCSNNLELSILGDEKTVSKAVAESQLNTFFSTNKPVAVKIIHRMDSNPSLIFAVAQLKTSGGNFRVSYSIKSTNGNQEMTELRIETEKGP